MSDTSSAEKGSKRQFTRTALVREGVTKLFDASVLLPIAPALAGLFWLDAVVAKTYLMFLLGVVIAAGAGSWVRKVLFPFSSTLENAALARESATGAALQNIAVAIVVAAVILAASSILQ